MKKTIIGVGGIWLLTGSAIALAGPASASTADTIVNDLQAEGYTVRINGSQTAPLTACKVTAVNKFSDGSSASVDIACPQGCGTL